MCGIFTRFAPSVGGLEGKAMYTVTREGRMWQIMKDGKLFTTTHSQLTAEHIACSLNQAKTPTPFEYTTNQILEGQQAEMKSWKH